MLIIKDSMTKYLWLVLACTSSLTACKKVDKFTQFDMEFNETATIPSSTGIDLPTSIFTPDVETNSEQTFAVNDTRKDKIESIVLTDLDLTIITPDSEDFSFLKSIAVYMSASGLPEIELAYKDVIPDTATQLIMDTSGEDLQEYIKKDEFNIRISAVTDEIIATDYELNVHQIFFVDAKVLGQ